MGGHCEQAGIKNGLWERFTIGLCGQTINSLWPLCECVGEEGGERHIMENKEHISNTNFLLNHVAES